MSPKYIRTGRRWAYGVMLSMLGLSIAGNLSHTFHLDSNPSIRAIVYGIMWPLMVWAGIELFVRVPWQKVITHTLVRWVGILLVVAIAGLVSYRHLRGLLVADNEEWTVYTFGPLGVDGLMLMATLGLLLTRHLVAADQGADVERTRVVELEEADPWDPIVPAPVDPVPALTLADVMREPVSPAGPAAPVSPAPVMGEYKPLPGWSAQPAQAVAEGRKPRTPKWDEGKARTMLLEGSRKEAVATAVGVSPKTIQRLRARMVSAGEL